MRNLPRHILVVRLSSLGDVAILAPILLEFKRKYPKRKISVLTKNEFAPLFSFIESINIIPIDFKADFRGLLGLVKLSLKIKTLKVDAILDLHNVLRTKILKLLLNNIPFRVINKGRDEKKQLIQGKIFHQLDLTIERYIKVFADFGFNLSMKEPAFPPPKKLPPRVTKMLKGYKKPYIGIAPFAAHGSKIYPLLKMEKVISALSKTNTVILFGAKGNESKITQRISREFSNVVSVAGRFALDEELILMSHLSVMLSMDSGNAHMAAMMGINVVTLWGVTHPYAGFIPYNQPMDNCLMADRERFPKVPTSVYGDKYPKGYEKAIWTISEQDIIEVITKKF